MSIPAQPVDSTTQISVVETDTQIVIRFPKHTDLDMKIYNPAFFEMLGFHHVETSIVLPTAQTGGAGDAESVDVDQRLTYPYKYFQFLFKRMMPSPGNLALIPTTVSTSNEPVAANPDVIPKESGIPKETSRVEFPKSNFNPLKSMGDALSSAYNNMHLPEWAKTNGLYAKKDEPIRESAKDPLAKESSAKESSADSLFKTHPVELEIPNNPPQAPDYLRFPTSGDSVNNLKPLEKPVEKENPEKSSVETRPLADLETKTEIPKEPVVEQSVVKPLPSPDEEKPVEETPQNIPKEPVPVPVPPVITETVEIIIPLDTNKEREIDDDVAAQDDVWFDDVLRFSRLEHQYSVYVRGEFQLVLGRLIKLGPVEQQSPETPDTLAEYLFERLTLDNTKIHKYAKLYATSPK